MASELKSRDDRTQVERAVAVAAGAVGERAGDPTLADAGRPADEDVEVVADPAPVGEREDEVESVRCGPGPSPRCGRGARAGEGGVVAAVGGAFPFVGGRTADKRPRGARVRGRHQRETPDLAELVSSPSSAWHKRTLLATDELSDTEPLALVLRTAPRSRPAAESERNIPLISGPAH